MSEALYTENQQQNTLHRSFIKKVDDSGDQQLIDYDGLDGEKHTKVLRIMPHGLASNPPPDSEAVVAGLGTRDMPVVVGGESPKHRPRNLPVGATRLYDTADGFVYLDADGNLHAKVNKGATIEAGETATVKAPTIKLEGNVQITGNLTVGGNISNDGSVTSTGPHKASGHI